MEDPTKYKQELNKMKEYKDEIKYVCDLPLLIFNAIYRRPYLNI